MITEKYSIYDFTGMHFEPPKDGMRFRDGFALRFKLNSLPTADGVLFEVPGSFKVTTRDIPSDDAEGPWEERENFRSLLEADGHCHVVEIEIYVEQPDHPEWQSMKIGIPVALLGSDWRSREIVMAYTKMRLQIFVDGELVNENLPVGWLKEPTGGMNGPDGSVLSDFQIATDVSNIRRTEHERTYDCSVQHYLPRGFNTWAGDVILFNHDGVFHLVYFLDRHHHENRWHCGAHHFQQLTSTNLIDWIDHGPLFELDEPWQSVGTGTMFFHRGRYYMAHGWHTSRVVPYERTASVLLDKYYSEHGKMRPFERDDLFGMTPSGATYAVSNDGVHFTPSQTIINTAENPSIYTNPDDSLTLYCGSGTWKAKDIDSDWRLVDPDFPKCGPDMPMRNSNECPSFFNWNGFRYLIMGFTGFWIAKGDGEFVDSAAQGHDIYDGLGVPMVAQFKDRMILGGWLDGLGWGSCVVLRELIQYPDGRLGMKWPAELAPKTGKVLYDISETAVDVGHPLEMDFGAGQAVYAEMRIHAPTEGRMAVRLMSAEDSAHDCEFQLDFGKRRMQIAPCGENGAFHPEIQTIREGLKTMPQTGTAWAVKASHGIPANGRNFCLENVDVMQGTFTLKMMVHYIPKMRGTVLDVEVAGQRTLISNRVHLKPSRLVVAADLQPIPFDCIEISELN